MGKRERRRRREAVSASTAPPAAPVAVPTVDTLRRLVERRDHLERTIDCEVDRLAEAGVGWPQIASALGVSRQAARQAALRRRGTPRVTSAPRGSWEMDDPGIEVELDGDVKHVEKLHGSWSSGDNASYH
jgi:hypothetical protein